MLFGFREPSVPSVDPEHVKTAMDSGESCTILDVRTPGEFSRGKLNGSINVPIDRLERDVHSQLPDTKQKIYVYCLSGARSAVAVEIMLKLGYSNVYNMSHGMLAWRVKYFPVE